MKTLLWTLAAVTALSGCSKKESAGKKHQNKKATMTADKKPSPRTEPRSAARPNPRARPMAVEVEAVVADMAGTVTIQSPGMDARPATKDMTAHPGDILRTDADGRVTLVLWDKTAVELAPDSALLVEESDSVEDPSPGFTVIVGLAHIEAAERKPGMGALVVHTPNAAVTVTGTALDVGVGLDATAKVGVEHGSVEVTGDAAIESKPVTLPKGKALVVTRDGKPAKLTNYRPAKEDWDAWLDKTNKAAQARADQVVVAHKKAIDQLEKNAQTLKKATAEVVKNAQATMEDAEKAVAAKKEKEFIAVQPKVVAAIDSASAAYQTQRMFESQLQARAFLIALLAAQARAGIIKLPKPKAQVVMDGAQLLPTFRIRWKNLHQRSKRNRRMLRRGYYRFHPRGWQVAAVVGAPVKPVTADIEFKPRPYRPVRVAVPGYTMPLYRPPFINVKIRPGVKVRLHPHGWHRRGGWGALVTAPGLVRWRKEVVARRLRRRHRGPRIRIQWRGPHVRTPGIRIRGGAKAHVHLKPVHVGRGGIKAPGVRVHGGGIRAGSVRIRGKKVRVGGTLRIRGGAVRAGNIRVHMRGRRRRRHHGMGHGMRHGMGHM